MANQWLIAGIGALVVLVTYGIPLFFAEYFPWQSLWKQRYGRPTVTTKSYSGRTALITGANGAFGSRAAKIFASRDIATLVLVDVRDCSLLKAEIEKELKENGKPIPNILVWQIDMMTFDGCRVVEQRARKELKNLDHVLLTAGILAFNRRESPEGWETCECGLSISSISNLKLTNSSHQNSNPSQLPLHRPHRPASRPPPQIFPQQLVPPSPHLRHFLRHLSRLIHHGSPQDRLLPQAHEHQQRRHAAGAPVRPIQGSPPLLCSRTRRACLGHRAESYH